MDKSIEEFFDERKNNWRKSKIKASMSDEKKAALEWECEEKFALDNWLPDAAKRAGQLSMVTHPGKFTHPSAKISSIIAQFPQKADGFLRTGNNVSSLDVFGNAAALDVHKFLSLKLDDGKKLIDHIEEETETAKKQLAVGTASFEEIREGFLAIKESDETAVTSEKVKQVYFPCDNDYHLLSILTPSGLMFELKNCVNDMRFSDQTREARELKRKGEHCDAGFDDLFNLSVIGYGGTKPQNISVLNNQNGGKTYLLLCMPPALQKRKIRLPRFNFFENSLWAGNFKESFDALHKLLVVGYNNINIREGRNNIIKFIIDQVIDVMWSIRQHESGWSRSDHYSNLPAHQKIWLDNFKVEERESSDEWLNKIVDEFSRWIVFAYKKSLGKQAVSLGDDELLHIKGLIEENKEALR
ncbi:MAG: type I-F CRISPR-associated protein Csy1 [Desulfobacterales bacterium]|nr:type I-F CRISPR-associated protein Csy1 [Desulfobacterales bacterium]